MPADSGEQRPAKPQQLGAPPPAPENEHLPCPRCDSTNTKFCYYNNYNLSQPRYFCKSCRRYWTKGGTLRNIPAGGCNRKNAKRSRTSSASQDHQIPATPVSAFPAAEPDSSVPLRDDVNLNVNWGTKRKMLDDVEIANYRHSTTKEGEVKVKVGLSQIFT
ncbi:hypothetical protein HHK36_010012 [Tetracentron sinense]|uniref:Dof zinc finger protein n=1 Tax=Tetracentron sinense TaxID=13715 RepID=A0A834ZBT0_TETSI|nr:hypothetical protein HHK36_010012 [Tetracentron sinense]